ncbi:hypothetical protein ACFLSA_06350 [Bacteroidota bacterium]
MKTSSINTGFLQTLHYLYNKITSSKIFIIPATRLVFKPNRKSTVQINYKEMKIDTEKHYHRTVAKPVVEKQTLLKEKKKAKSSH